MNADRARPGLLCLPPLIDHLDPEEDLLPAPEVVAAIVQERFANDACLQEIGESELTDDEVDRIAVEILRTVDHQRTDGRVHE